VASRLGGARVLGAGVLLWSVGTLLAPPAATAGLTALCCSRLLVGLGEGVAPSAATQLIVAFVPAAERARAVSLVWGGLDLGSVVGLLIAPFLIAAAGWQSVFYVFALLGFAWCALWPVAQPHASASVARLAATASGVAPAPAKRKRTPWLSFARSPAVWAVVVTHFCFNYGYYTLLAWLPSYFEGALGMSLGASSTLSLLPYVAMVAMTPVVGPVADAAAARLGVTTVRKAAQALSFLGPAACMLALAALTPVTPAAAAAAAAAMPALPTWLLGAAGGGAPPVALVVALMSLAFGLSAWSRAGLYCNHQDLSPRYASILLGVSNTAGALPGVLGVWAAGVLLDVTGSWPLAVFLPTAAAQLLGTLVFSCFGSGENQGWDSDE
jgi:ACS family sodium-dependent inorganic phosphate cotransporter